MRLSRRLYAALQEEYERQFRPGPNSFIQPGINARNFRRREWRRVLAAAGLASIRLKDLRDTWACYLLQAGVQLGYVSSQLGHSTVAVTARHYARWIEAQGWTRCGCVKTSFRPT